LGSLIGSYATGSLAQTDHRQRLSASCRPLHPQSHPHCCRAHASARTTPTRANRQASASPMPDQTKRPAGQYPVSACCWISSPSTQGQGPLHGRRRWGQRWQVERWVSIVGSNIHVSAIGSDPTPDWITISGRPLIVQAKIVETTGINVHRSLENCTTPGINRHSVW